MKGKHTNVLITKAIIPDTGPKVYPIITKGRAENCIFKNSGKIGSGNLKKYNK